METSVRGRADEFSDLLVSGTPDMLKSVVGAVHGRAVLGRRKRVLSTLIGTMLAPQSRVLDVGTGDGQIAESWGSICPGVAVQGIDVFVRKETHIPVSAFNGQTIPYPDKSMDYVTFIDVLHHATNKEVLLSEASRVARRGILIKDHIAESRVDHQVLRLMDWVGNAPHGVVLPYDYLSYAAWMRLFDHTGLKVASFEKRIPLYVFPLSCLLGRGLHFIADVRP